MTPQQDELQLAFEAWAAENGVTAQRYQGKLGLGYWGEANRFFRAYKDAWNRRAPAPTEPAVDRDAWVQTKEGLPIPKEYARRLYQGWQAMSGINLSFDGFIAKYGYFLSLDSIIACWGHHKGGPAIRAALATPASPAVPVDPSDVLFGWKQGIADAAFYVEGHCANGEHHAETIMGMKPPKITSAAPAVPAPAPLAPNRDAQQIAALLLVDPETGEQLHIAGPLESWGMGLSQGKLMTETGKVWTMVAGLREGYKSEAERNRNLLRAVDEELAAPQPDPAAMHRLICQLASLSSCTPEAVNLLVEEARRVMGQDGGAEGGDGEQLREMVNRFLGWRLPDTFSPDCGISFKPLGHPNDWPVGTNLLTADEARAMFEYVLACNGTDKVAK